MTTWINLDSSSWPHIGLMLVHFLWQGALIALFAAGLLFLLRHRSPESRYIACGCGLVLMAAAPPITLWSVRHSKFVESNPIAQLTNEDALDSRRTYAPEQIETIEDTMGDNKLQITHRLQEDAVFAGATDEQAGAIPGESAASIESADLATLPLSIQSSRSAPAPGRVSDNVALDRLLRWSAVFWFCGVVLFAIRLTVGWGQLLRLTGSSHSQDPPHELAARFIDIARRMHCVGKARIKTCRIAVTPVTFGFLKPIVLIPAAMLAEVSPQWIECIIAHELAHVRRRDAFMNLIQRVIESLLFFHPAVWWLSDRMRLERELCCDDIAVKVAGCPADYAEALVTTARRARGPRVFTAQDALASGITGGRISISARVRRILSGDRGYDGSHMRNWMAGPIALMAAGSIFLVSRIEAAENGGVPQSAEVAIDDTADGEMATELAESLPQTSMIETDFRAAKSWQDRVKSESEAVRHFLPIVKGYQSFHEAIYGNGDDELRRVFAPGGQTATNQDIEALRSDIDAMGFANANSLFEAPWVIEGVYCIDEAGLALLSSKSFAKQSHGENWYYALYCTMQKTTGGAWIVRQLAILPTGGKSVNNFVVDKSFIQDARDVLEQFLFDAIESIGRDQASEPIVCKALYLSNWTPGRIYSSQVWRRPMPTTTRSGRIELVDQRDLDDQSFTLLGPVRNLSLVVRSARRGADSADAIAALDAIQKVQQAKTIHYPLRTQASGIIAEVSPALREALTPRSGAVEVKKGQLLLRLVDDEIKLDLAEAEVRLELAQSRYNRVQTLADAQKTSSHELEEAKAQMHLAQLNVERQTLALLRMRVTAPADGMLSCSRKDVGGWGPGVQVEAGQLFASVSGVAESSQKSE